MDPFDDESESPEKLISFLGMGLDWNDLI